METHGMTDDAVKSTVFFATGRRALHSFQSYPFL